MHYCITIPRWSQQTGLGLAKFSQYEGQLEGYEVGLFKSSTHEGESDKLYQSGLLPQNFEFKRAR